MWVGAELLCCCSNHLEVSGAWGDSVHVTFSYYLPRTTHYPLPFTGGLAFRIPPKKMFYSARVFPQCVGLFVRT